MVKPRRKGQDGTTTQSPKPQDASAPAASAAFAHAAAPFAPWASGVSLEAVRARHDAISAARNWHQFHTPRNLVLALAGEVGELAELFQWRTDADSAPDLPGFTPEQKHAVAEELSDVLCYTVRIATACGIDLGSAAMAKFAVSEAKYPAALVRGSAKKYTEYRAEARAAAAAAEAAKVGRGPASRAAKAPRGAAKKRR